MSDAIPSSTQRDAWLARAAACARVPAVRVVEPVTLVQPVADEAAWQGWRMERTGAVAELAAMRLRRGARVHLDLGEHLVGHLELDLTSAGAPPDSPLRLRIVLAERPAESAEADLPANGGLSHAWYQDETITVEVVPAVVRLPRRLAGRWLTLTVIDTSPLWDLVVRGVRFHAASGAGEALPAPAGLTPRLAAIDRVALHTLRNCQQTVYEDGPKRDRRLWTGDLRLQLLTDGVTFRNLALTERSLCLLAAFTRAADGAFPASCFEHPTPHASADMVTDYCLALPAILRELLRQGGDRELVAGLAPLARHQIGMALGWLGTDGVVELPAAIWTFIDWHDQLDKRAPLHGVLCWALDAWIGLAAALGLAVGDDPARLASLRAAGRTVFGEAGQASWGAAAWMVLGGVVQGEVARRVLSTTMADPAAVRPGGPYLMHHMVHALWVAGERERGRALIDTYWGGMLDRGADTFWEIYAPDEPRRTPYGDHRLNSACHAWSCTPSWFLRAPERAASPS